MNQLVLFDYSALDTTIRSSIEQRAERIRQRNQTIALNVWENGRDFYEAQQELAQHRHGCFQEWAEAETGYSIRTVYNFIRVYRTFNHANFAQLNFAPSALYMLAAPSTPADAVEEAIERAENGERITHSAAKDIVSQHKDSALIPAAEWQAPPQYADLKEMLVEADRDVFICPVCNDIFDNEVWHCESCNHHWPMHRETCHNCYEPRQAQPEVIEARPMPHVAHNSGNNEWYTPSKYIEAARAVMGGIDLDPASNDAANEVVKATTYHTINDDGLLQMWTGRVWMNPPYAAGLVERFAEKLVYHYESGDVTEAIVLVNNATETGWFRCLAAASRAICFPGSRVRFWSPNGESSAPLQGQAILYMGKDIEAFVSEFAPLGLLVEVL